MCLKKEHLVKSGDFIPLQIFVQILILTPAIYKPGVDGYNESMGEFIVLSDLPLLSHNNFLYGITRYSF